MPIPEFHKKSPTKTRVFLRDSDRLQTCFITEDPTGKLVSPNFSVRPSSPSGLEILSGIEGIIKESKQKKC